MSKHKKKIKRRKKSNWELLFIEEHGWDIYDYIRIKYSRCAMKSEFWRSLLIAGCTFDPPLTPRLKKLYDDFMDIPADYDKEADDGKD